MAEHDGHRGDPQRARGFDTALERFAACVILEFTAAESFDLLGEVTECNKDVADLTGEPARTFAKSAVEDEPRPDPRPILIKTTPSPRDRRLSLMT